MTAKERRINELKSYISGTEEELSYYVKDLCTSALEKKISDLNTEISCLDEYNDDDCEKIDAKEGLIESIQDLIDARMELDKLDPPYTPAKYKDRPKCEARLNNF